jgi:hypothetical protein
MAKHAACVTVCTSMSVAWFTCDHQRVAVYGKYDKGMGRTPTTKTVLWLFNVKYEMPVTARVSVPAQKSFTQFVLVSEIVFFDHLTLHI